MTERPILFSGPMVRALLAGTKTQTRRVVRGVEECPHGYDAVRKVDGATLKLAGGARVSCPYGQPGDRLWVRETWAPSGTSKQRALIFRADEGTARMALQAPEFGRWRPAIHMPRTACRLVLEVTGVRVERLQAISDRDAMREGVEQLGDNDGAFRAAFRVLWESLNARRGYGWQTNPWVWVLEFRRAA